MKGCEVQNKLDFSEFSTMNQNLVQELILAWLWLQFHLVYWMRRDSNPQSFNRESSSLTTRPVLSNWQPGGRMRPAI